MTIFSINSGSFGDVTVTGIVSASTLKGDGSQITSVSYDNIASKPTLISSSTQVEALLPGGTLSSSVQVDITNTTGYSTFSGSLATIDTAQTNRLNTIESFTGSYATTGSNTFTGAQTFSDTTNTTSYLDGAIHIAGGMSVRKDVRISGSMTINGLLTAVSMSTQYVTSSQYNVGTSRITLNDDDNVRFAGLSIIDSGSSSPTSASILWDSLQHRFIYENLSGSAYNSSIIIAGPKHTGTLGDEPTLTSGYVPYATGGDHIDNSVIFQTGSNIGIGTTNPSSKLEVSNSNITISSLGSSTNSTFKGVSINTADLGGSTGNAGVYLSAPYGGGTTNQAFFRVKRGASDTYNGSEIAFSNKFRFLGSTTEDTNERLRIDEYGNISFGGAVPAEKLDFGDSTAAIRMKTGNSAQYITSLFDSYDYFSIANNYRRTGASAGTIGNSGLGTAEILFTNLGANAATIKFLVGNTNTAPSTKMTITTSGNVGIGVDSPDQRLHVSGSGTVVGHIQSSGTYSILRLTNSSRSSDIGTDSTGLYMDAGGAFPITFYAGSSERMRITSAGNVGIGTTNPNSLLEVYKASGTNYIYTSNGTANTFNGLMIRYSTTDYMGFIGNPFTGETRLGGFNASGYFTTIYSNNAETMRITAGNVGIGTTDPGSYKLRVNGTARIESGLDLGGGLGAGMANAHTKTLSGNYSSGTWYELAGKSDLDSGVFIVVAYVDTYSAGSAIYYMYFASVPFFFTDINSNGPDSAQLPVLIGTGHAQNGVSPPDIRVRQTYSDAGIFVEFRPNATWTGLDGTAGKNVTFYVKRIA